MSYGHSVFSQNGTRIFGTDLRTQNLQYNISLTLTSQATSQFFPMADANDSTKVVVAVISEKRLFPGMYSVNTSSTGFTITNSRSFTQTCIGLAFRIG